MSPLTPQEIENRLKDRPTPPPPPTLLKRLTSEIPEIPGSGLEDRTTPRSRRSRWLAAASVLVAIAGGVLGYRTLREVQPESSEAPPVQPRSLRNESTAAPVETLSEDLQADPQSAPRAPRPEIIQTPAESDASGTSDPTVEAGPESPSTAVADEREARIPTLEKRQRTSDRPPVSPQFEVMADGSMKLVPGKPAAAPDTDSSGAESSDDFVWSDQFIASEGHIFHEETNEASASGAGTPDATMSSSAEAPLRARPRLRTSRDTTAHSPQPSTGGTAEPNDQPYGDVFFREYGVNPFIDTEDDHLSTFGLDVDTGSYTVARRYLEDGHLPPREAIRVEEFLNYFDYGDAPPSRGDFALHADLGPAPFATGERYRLLRFGIRGRMVDEEHRKPATLIFVVDVSGSMERQNRLQLVIRSLELLLDQLRSDDRVGLVIYGSRGEVLLRPTGDHQAIASAIRRLRPGGSTNAEEGLALAYEEAAESFREGTINRIILCSDGVANVGNTGPDSILERVRRHAARGIELTTVGFGMGNYNDVLMEQLADKGNGRYAYVDDLAEAQRVFVENLAGTLQTIAGDAKAQVEFNPAVVSRYRLLGYENRDIADQRFRDDSVDAGEIGSGHTVSALYEIKLHENRPRKASLATLHLRWQSKSSGKIEEIARAVSERDGTTSWRGAPASLKLAAAAAELAEILKGSYWAREASFEQLLEVARDASAGFGEDRDVAELVGLVAKAAKLDE